jgi:hypothetical protein
VDEGLRQVLKNEDVFFFYTAAEKLTLRAVWVYPKGSGNGIAPVPFEMWGSTKEIEHRLVHSDPEERSRAVMALVQRKHHRSMEIVLQALKDDNEKV